MLGGARAAALTCPRLPVFGRRQSSAVRRRRRRGRVATAALNTVGRVSDRTLPAARTLLLHASAATTVAAAAAAATLVLAVAMEASVWPPPPHPTVVCTACRHRPRRHLQRHSPTQPTLKAPRSTTGRRLHSCPPSRDVLCSCRSSWRCLPTPSCRRRCWLLTMTSPRCPRSCPCTLYR